MDLEPNYNSYSKEELIQARDSIDKEKYPDRFAAIISRLETIKVSEPESTTVEESNDKGSIISGIYSIIVGVGLLWLTWLMSEQGTFKSRQFELNQHEDPILFSIRVALSLIAAGFFLYLGFRSIFNEKRK